ncbi:hypothetical protein [Pseudomonas nitroreducens]|uniref:hypothetical protein n=1 Tax=Pseudomonas nitroreducens TaxID=46680 RepID=UPI003CC81816
MSYFEETDLPIPDLDGNGQGTDCLKLCPVARANRPPAVGVVDASNLAHLEGTDLFLWYGRRSSGYWTPFGKVLRITDEGVQALRSELETCADHKRRYVESLLSELAKAKEAA